MDKGTLRRPYNPLGNACINPRRKQRGILQRLYIKKGMGIRHPPHVGQPQASSFSDKCTGRAVNNLAGRGSSLHIPGNGRPGRDESLPQDRMQRGGGAAARIDIGVTLAAIDGDIGCIALEPAACPGQFRTCRHTVPLAGEISVIWLAAGWTVTVTLEAALAPMQS